jgi:hypothetical protein
MSLNFFPLATVAEAWAMIVSAPPGSTVDGLARQIEQLEQHPLAVTFVSVRIGSPASLIAHAPVIVSFLRHYPFPDLGVQPRRANRDVSLVLYVPEEDGVDADRVAAGRDAAYSICEAFMENPLHFKVVKVVLLHAHSHWEELLYRLIRRLFGEPHPRPSVLLCLSSLTDALVGAPFVDFGSSLRFCVSVTAGFVAAFLATLLAGRLGFPLDEELIACMDSPDLLSVIEAALQNNPDHPFKDLRFWRRFDVGELPGTALLHQVDFLICTVGPNTHAVLSRRMTERLGVETCTDGDGACNLATVVAQTGTLYGLSLKNTILGKRNMTDLCFGLNDAGCTVESLALGGTTRENIPCLSNDVVEDFFRQLPSMPRLCRLEFRHVSPASLAPIVLAGVKDNYGLRELRGLTFDAQDPATNDRLMRQIAGYIHANAHGRNDVHQAAKHLNDDSLQDAAFDVIHRLTSYDNLECHTSLFLCLKGLPKSWFVRAPSEDRPAKKPRKLGPSL